MSPYYRIIVVATAIAILSACGPTAGLSTSASQYSGLPATERGSVSFEILHYFQGGTGDGSVPDGIVAGPNGTLLGATISGGHIHPRDCKGAGCGTIFQLTDSNEQPIYLFQPQPSGFHPVGNMLEHDGVYYGAAAGGAYGLGMVFALSKNSNGKWVATTLHSFSGHPNDGAQVGGIVYINARGVIFGTTRMGGSGTGCSFSNTGCGTFFSLQPSSQPGGSWSESVLHSFQGDPDGAAPGPYVVRKNGSFYGTTDLGGAAGQCPDDGGCGAIYKLTPTGSGATESLAYSFRPSQSSTDGSLPTTLIDGGDGNFYGTTAYGGGNQTCSEEPHVYGCGTFFSLTFDRSSKLEEKMLYAFAGGRDARQPNALVGSARNGFYGTSGYGGSGGCVQEFGCGTIFRFVRSHSSWKQSLVHIFQERDGRIPSGPVVFDGSHLIGTTMYGGMKPCPCGIVYELDI